MNSSLIRTLLLFAACCCGSVATLRAQTAAAAAAPPAVSSVAVPAEKLHLSGIPNAGRVNDFLYRGAQPRPAGYDELKQLGISLVVDLHNYGEDSRRERVAVESRGMRYVNIPSGFYHGPTIEQIAEFLLLVRDNPGQRIFVHCQRGGDRTGVMIAAFRMTQHRWTLEQARTEMLNFHFHQSWLPAMRRTIRDFPKNYENSAAFSKLHPAPEQGRAAAQTHAQ